MWSIKLFMSFYQIFIIHNSVSLGFEKYVQKKEDDITESILKDALGGFLLEEESGYSLRSGQSVKILELEDEESNKVRRAIFFYKKNSKGVDEQLFNDVLMMRVFVNDVEDFLKLLDTAEDVSQIWKGISRSVEYHFAEAKMCAAKCNYPWKNEKSNLRQMIKFYDIYRPRGRLCPVHWIYVKGRKYVNEKKKIIPVREGFNCWVIEGNSSLCDYYRDLGVVPHEKFKGWHVCKISSIDYWRSVFAFINNTCAEDCHFGFAKVPIMYGEEVKSIPGILEDFVVLVVVENSSGKNSDKIPTDDLSENMLTNLNQLMNYMYANIALRVVKLIVDKAKQEGYDVYEKEFADWLDERVLKIYKDNGELTSKGKLFIEWRNLLKTSIPNQIYSTKNDTNTKYTRKRGRVR